jgi:DNA-3-methyladenine glycosylase II
MAEGGIEATNRAGAAQHILFSQLHPPNRILHVPAPFDLSRTAAPVAWGKGRWPNTHWADGALIWCGVEDGSIVWRAVSQASPTALQVSGTASEAGDATWVTETLGIERSDPAFTDPTLCALMRRHVGMKPFAHGSIWEGLASAIVGQGVSVAGGATLLSRIAALVHPGVALAGRTLWPLPTPADVAALGSGRLKGVGLTAQRAEALAAVARAMGDGAWSDRDGERFRSEAISIRGVGRWTIESTLLWGLGDDDVHPSGDVALLRAARRAFADDALSMRALDALSERWRPHRGWAARLLWLELLGPAT